MKIVIDDKIPFIRGVLEPYAEVIYKPGGAITKADLKDAEALIVRTRTQCNEKLLASTAVRFIATATIGYDHIDDAWCKANGITWVNAPGCNSGSVAQYIAAVLVFLSQKHHFFLQGKTLGIIGVGNVGRKVSLVAKAFGMHVLENDPPRARMEGVDGNFVELDELLNCSDIVTMHVPLNDEGLDKTFHLADSSFFERMKREAIFINTSRGEVNDTAALLYALENGKIRDAVCDVWENEPGINLDLLGRVCLATPHIAGYSVDGKANGTAMSVEALSRFFDIDLHNWRPAKLPQPECPVILLDGSKMNSEALLGAAVNHTYDIKSDDKNLRNAPEKFEAQRGAYPARREFPAYIVSLRHGNASASDALQSLGFQNRY